MFDLAEVDLSSVYIFDASPLTHVTRVGKHKAIGYVNFSATVRARFRPPLVCLRQLGEMLESRGMKVYYDGGPSGRGHQQEIADLVQQLPQVTYDRKLVPAHSYFGENSYLPHTLIAADPVTIEKLLESNRKALYGFPPSVDAFVDLIRTVHIDHKLPLGELIRLAFLHYQLYGDREIPRLFASEQPPEPDLSDAIRKLQDSIEQERQQSNKLKAEIAAMQRELDELRAIRKGRCA